MYGSVEGVLGDWHSYSDSRRSSTAIGRGRRARQRSSTQTVAQAYSATPTNRLTRITAPLSTLLPLALSSIAGPSRISDVIRALLQNDGRKVVRRAPNSADPAHSAAAIIHSISIHRLGHSDRPSQ